MMTSFGDLPGELYTAIVEQVPDEDVKNTVLSLTRIFPSAPIPLQPLFRRIRIGIARQAILLYSRLRRRKGENSEDPARTWVQALSINAWTVDANVVLNIVNLLPNLESLEIWIGPENFAPEHLEELFEKPIQSLRYLSLRFRPYVQKANYYQFLKGAYFDSVLVALSRWPSSQISALSITQDPIDSSMAFSNRQSFAQPLVFFKTDPILSILLRSPAMAEPLTSFRLRIPGRPAVRSLCLPAATSQYNGDGQPHQVPAIEILDLSTCNVLEGEVDMILAQFQTLKHLLLDDCPVLSGELREGEWNAMGKRCALVGVRRAREREKVLKASLESFVLAGPDGAAVRLPEARRVRKGRRGLATATISLRAPSPPPAPRRATDSRTPRPAIPRIRILPCLPSLKTLCTTVSTVVRPTAYTSIRSEFEAGWAEGIAVLNVTRGRLRESAKNGVNIVRFAEAREDSSSESESEGWKLKDHSAAFHSLEKVDRNDAEAFSIPVEFTSAVPILCFAGSKGLEDHPPGCGHSIAQTTWKDRS